MSVRHTRLVDLGDPNAPPGTRDWAASVRISIQKQLNKAENSARSVKTWIEGFCHHDGWKVLRKHDDSHFESFADFCVTPEPHGLGHPQAFIDAIRGAVDGATVGAVRKLMTHGGDRKSEAAKDQADNVSLKYGNSTEYLRERLKRDHPETRAALDRGEYPSVHAAARAAGIVKVRALHLSEDPETAASAIVKKFGRDYALALGTILVG